MLRKVLMLAACGALAVGVASANVPDPNLSNVPECLVVAPGNAGTFDDYSVTIVGSGGPLNGSLVQIRFNAVGDTLTCWCSSNAGPRPYVFSGNTNGSGIATFQIRAGGCIEKGLAAIPGNSDFAGEIYADGIRMQEFGTVSPDVTDSNGNRPTATGDVWNPAGSCATGLADAVEHGTPLGSGTSTDWCSDMDCNGVVGGTDGVRLTPFLGQAISCAGNP